MRVGTQRQFYCLHISKRKRRGHSAPDCPSPLPSIPTTLLKPHSVGEERVSRARRSTLAIRRCSHQVRLQLPPQLGHPYVQH